VVLLLGGLDALLLAADHRVRDLPNPIRAQPGAVAACPQRGLIYDRNGVLLADNQPSYILSVVRESVADLDATLSELQALVPITQSDLENFHKKLNGSALPRRCRCGFA
jgi:penicillin-binding protein 2